MTATIVAKAYTMPDMAKDTKPATVPIAIRLPPEILPEIDAAAKLEYASRARWIADLVIDKVKELRKGKAKGKEKG
jgi:metal-responsive CopG/Arc/MetJ family transcriptional regulator